MAVKNELVHCDLCGEDYSSVYRRCPFCEGRGGNDWSEPDPREPDDSDDYDEEDDRRPTRRVGGRHLARRARGGGYDSRRVIRTVLFLFSLALIVAAAWIIVTTILPRLLPKNPAPPATDTVETGDLPPVETLSPNPATPIESDPLPTESDPLPTESEPLPTESEPATPIVSPSALRLNRADFTLDNQYPSFRMTASGGTGTIRWSSSNTTVVTVSESGTVTAVGTGDCTVTATDDAGNAAKCIVRVAAGFGAGVTPSPSPSPDPSPSPSPSPSQSTGAAKLSTSDATLNEAYGYAFTLRVSNGTAASWSSSNTGIVTVSDSGKVTGVGNGIATIAVTLTDGTVLKCTVRVSGL